MKSLVTKATVLTLLIAGILTLGLVPAVDAVGNKGTIKVHDEEDADPDRRNEPHVSCDFWIEGFNMKHEEGFLVFYHWPPGGDKDEVTPTGVGLDWTGAEEEDNNGGFHFLNGPYFLDPGHYKVEAWVHGVHEDKKAKSKVFWVDECENGEHEECPDTDLDVTANGDGSIDVTLDTESDEDMTILRSEDGGAYEEVATLGDGETYHDTDTEVGLEYTYIATLEIEGKEQTCAIASVTAIPLFPGAAFGAVALAGCVGAYAVFRRRD